MDTPAALALIASLLILATSFWVLYLAQREADAARTQFRMAEDTLRQAGVREGFERCWHGRSRWAD